MAFYHRWIWFWEGVAIMSSLISLILMAALLAAFDNTKVFLIHGVTLNAVIALLSTLSKTTLLFVLTAAVGQWKWIFFSRSPHHIIDAYLIDEASRGPWGSLLFIWRMKGVSLACIGALCTVLALALDPFTQQLIRLRNDTVYVTSANTTIPRAQRFSKGTFYRIPIGSLGDSIFNVSDARDDDPRAPSVTWASPDPSVQSAVLYGLTQPADLMTQQLPRTCDTGNCTFELFTSLAVCSKCVDYPERLASSPEYYTYAANSLTKQAGSTWAGNGTKLTLQNGLFLDNLNETSRGQIFPFYMSTFGTGNASKTTSFQDIDTLIWSMSLLRWRPDRGPADAVWPNVSLDAMECALYYCVNEYQSQIENGVLHEIVTLRPEFRRDPDSWQADMEERPNSLPVTDSLEYHDKLSYLLRTDLSLGKQFNISKAAVDSISKYFKFFFSDPYMRKYDQVLNGFYLGPSREPEFWPDGIQALYDSDNLVTTFHNLASSLSNAFRAGADEQLQQQGRAGHTEIRYEIKWSWITLHVFVVAVGLLYLLITAYEASRVQAPAWKSHLLASMALGGQVGDLMTGLTTTHEMEQRAWHQTASLYHGISTEDPDQHLVKRSVSARQDQSETRSFRESFEMLPSTSTSSVIR